MGLKTDAQLNDALNLIHLDPSASHSLREKFRLDASVSADGDNFSAGEKQLRKWGEFDVHDSLSVARSRQKLQGSAFG